MLTDMIEKPKDIPENLAPLCEELDKLLRMVEEAKIPLHLDTATNFLNRMVRKWNLGTKTNPDVISYAISQKILAKRNQFILDDEQYAREAMVR